VFDLLAEIAVERAARARLGDTRTEFFPSGDHA
jgi:hypothetical protein